MLIKKSIFVYNNNNNNNNNDNASYNNWFLFKK